jgi:ATP-dependent DNA helicase RecG
VLGTKQTGVADLKIADLVRDAALIPQVKELAVTMWRDHPKQSAALINRWLAYKGEYSNA